jgi:hypothetical protein
MSHANPPRESLERALDGALSRALQPPQAPPHLRTRLRAAMAQAGSSTLAQARSQLDREHRELQTELAQQYVRLQRRTLGLIVGVSFAAGAVAAAALPWITAHLGAAAPQIAVSGGPLIGLLLGLSFWLGSRRDPGLQP